MKKVFAVLLTLFIIAGCLSACGKITDTNQNTASQTLSNPVPEKATLRLGGLKGPTSMGMVKLLEENEKGTTVNRYEFTMAASADELTPRFLKGDLDILAVPANLGSVLYNKSGGSVQMLAVNMLGALYIAVKGEQTVGTLADLKGKTLYATGKGSTPEYVLSYLLEQNGMEIGKDVTVEWKSEPTETVSAMAMQKNAVAMLPQPYVAVASTQIEDLQVALDLNEEWNNCNNGCEFVTACLMVRKAFAAEQPEAVKSFLREYESSVNYVNQNISDGASLIEKYDIAKAAVAEKSLKQCNLVCITGQNMIQSCQGYFNILFAQSPAAVGGAVPKEDFYLTYD